MAEPSVSKNQSHYPASGAVTLFVVSAVQFLTPFMLSAVGVALPAIGREFSASAVQLGLVEPVYIFAFSLFLIPAGRLGDIHGRKRIFMIGILVFTAGTVLICFAFTIESFIVFRFFQGCGGAMISGTSVAILSSVFSPATRGRAMGVIVGCVYLGLSLGLSSRIHAGTPMPMIMGILALMGVGFSLFSSPNTITVMGSVPPKSYGIASSFLATMRTAGMLCSMTIITLVFKHIMRNHPVSSETQSSFLASMHLCMIIFCFLCLAGVFCSTVRLKRWADP